MQRLLVLGALLACIRPLAAQGPFSINSFRVEHGAGPVFVTQVYQGQTVVVRFFARATGWTAQMRAGMVVREILQSGARPETVFAATTVSTSFRAPDQLEVSRSVTVSPLVCLEAGAACGSRLADMHKVVQRLEIMLTAPDGTRSAAQSVAVAANPEITSITSNISSAAPLTQPANSERRLRVRINETGLLAAESVLVSFYKSTDKRFTTGATFVAGGQFPPLVCSSLPSNPPSYFGGCDIELIGDSTIDLTFRTFNPTPDIAATVADYDIVVFWNTRLNNRPFQRMAVKFAAFRITPVLEDDEIQLTNVEFRSQYLTRPAGEIFTPPIRTVDWKTPRGETYTLHGYVSVRLSRMIQAEVYIVERRVRSGAIRKMTAVGTVGNTFGRLDTIKLLPEISTIVTDPIEDLEYFAILAPPNLLRHTSPDVAFKTSPVVQLKMEEVSLEGDIAVTGIQVVQVTQRPDNSVPLIAEKPTVVRVFVKSVGDGAKPIPMVTGTLRGIRRSGELEPLVTPLDNFASYPTYADPNPDTREYHSVNFLLPERWTWEGELELIATVRGPSVLQETRLDNNTFRAEKPFVFQIPPGFVKPYLVTYFPLCFFSTQDTNATACPSQNVMHSADQEVRRLFPVAPKNVLYLPLPGPAPVAVPLDPAGVIKPAWLLAAEGLTYASFVDSQSLGSINQHVGWIGENSLDTGYRPSGPIYPGFSYITEERAKGVSAFDHSTRVAKNILFNLLGKIDPGECPEPEAGFDTDQLHPVFGLQLIADVACTTHYEKLFATGLRTPRPSRPSPPPPTASKSGSRAAEGPTEQAVLTGFVPREDSGAQLDPVFRFTSPRPAPEAAGAGDFCLRFSGESGPLGGACFDASFEGAAGEAAPNALPFAVRAALPAGARRVALMRGDRELAAREASASTPEVTISSPAAGDVWLGSETRTVTWRASDADGGELSYTLQYSSDGGVNWLPLRVRLAATEVRFAASQIAGGTNVHFRVLASDGWNTGVATAGPIEIRQSPKLETVAEMDFRLAVAARGFATRRLALRNTGSGPLAITAIESDSAMFEVVDSAVPLVIPAGITREIGLRFGPPAEGAQTGTLTLTSESGEKIYVAMKGRGIAEAVPDVEVTPAALEFGRVAAGQTKDLPMVVRNHGPAPLLLTGVASNSTRFAPAAAGLPLLLAPGESRSINVRFEATGTAAVTGAISISSSDPERGTVRVNVSGNR